jgi:hypothetical protein
MSAAGWVGFDLDGTLAVYDGWKGVGHIGKPIPAVVAFLKNLRAHGVEVRIFTARCQEGRAAVLVIEQWCLHHLGEILPVTDRKDFNMAFAVDDRVFTVEANTGRFIATPPTAQDALGHWSVPTAPPQTFQKT